MLLADGRGHGPEVNRECAVVADDCVAELGGFGVLVGGLVLVIGLVLGLVDGVGGCEGWEEEEEEGGRDSGKEGG